jgi:hypothetical protein
VPAAALAYIAKPGWQDDSGCDNPTIASRTIQYRRRRYDTYNSGGWLDESQRRLTAQLERSSALAAHLRTSRSLRNPR